jgi:hypothetical protein
MDTGAPLPNAAIIAAVKAATVEVVKSGQLIPKLLQESL